MSTAHNIPVLKCKMCNDMIIASTIAHHHCIKLNQKDEKDSKSDRSFSVDQYCAVLENDTPCRNSITCKYHSIEQKNKVKGRIYPVEDIIKILKREKAKVKGGTAAKKHKLDPVIKEKAMEVVKNIKPVIEHKHWDQKYEREIKEIKNIFSLIKKNAGNDSSKSLTPMNEKNNKKIGLATRKYKQKTTKQNWDYE